MSEFTATARPLGGTLRHQIDVNGRHIITTDEPHSLGGTDTAPAPNELLSAMVASCVSTMIVLYAQRHGWQLGDVQVDVSYHTKECPRRIELTVHLPGGLTDEQVERLRRVADTCPVKRALEARFTFEAAARPRRPRRRPRAPRRITEPVAQPHGCTTHTTTGPCEP